MNPNATWTHLYQGEKWHNVTFDYGVVAEDDSVWKYSAARPGGQAGSMFTIPDHDVFHLPGLGYNGYWGIDLLSAAKNVFGLDQAGLDAAGYVFRNSGQPNLVLEAPIGTFPTHKEAQEFLAWFRKSHSGLSNSAKTALLREGITARTLPIDAADAQFLESRKFSRDDIALLLGVEYLMGESAAVYKDLAERQSAYVTNTLSRWIARFEEETMRKLFTPQQREGEQLCVRMDASILMRGSPNTLADYTGKLTDQGVVSINEVREIHGMNPVEESGDESTPIGESGEDGVREKIDAYGIAVRAGVLTPQEADEEYHRGLLGLPGASPAVGKSWDEDEGTRRPITIVTDGGESPFQQGPAPAEEDDGPDIANLIESVFADLIDYEVERVNRAAGQKGNFIGWFSKFYETTHRKTMISKCEACGLGADRAAEYCEARQSELMEICGVVTPDQLAGAIKDLSKNWRDSAKEFARCLT